jgi:hydrogenase-4 component B
VMSISALPPLNGFVSEWLVYLGLFDSATGRVPSSWVVLPAAITLGTAGALALATFVKVTTLTFLGAPRSYAAVSAHDCGRWMRGPMVGVAAACVALGLGPLLVWPLVSRAVGTWDTAWASSPAPPSLATLCTMQVAVVGLGAAMGGTLWWRVKANGLRRGLTWDCGYAQPTARMQYTGGSFGSLGAGWFFWLLRPERRLRRPRGVLPSGAIRLERIPETVLEKVMGPVATALVRVSSAVRRLQHGRLQAYVLYVVVGLAALGAIAALGSTP